jgi:hypothetical protein
MSLLTPNLEVKMSIKNLVSATHPKHYLIHKYWGRKAHNLIAYLIEKHSNPGDIVLDPYMGSGVSVIEANKAGRVGIGYDLNPISALITNVTLRSIDVESFLERGESIVKSIPNDIRELTITSCPTCGLAASYTNSVWADGHIARIKVRCPTCGIVVSDAREVDLKTARNADRLLAKAKTEGRFVFPDPELLRFVRRSGVTHLSGLFSSRNFLQVAYLYSEISATKSPELREALQIAFTSALPNVSSMIPGDYQSVTGKSGWQISKFWAPKIHTEKDVVTSFRARLHKVADALKEIAELKSSQSFETFTKSSTDMSEVRDESVALVIADPPYGDSIAYLGLSMFWNAWLDVKVDYESEVIVDSSRNKTLDAYRVGLFNAFKEVRRVMKLDGKLVVTFNNRHMKFWQPLIEAIDSAGFELEKLDWIDQAVRSGTQGINHQNTLHGDFVYTYSPRLIGGASSRDAVIAGDIIVAQTLRTLFKETQRLTTASLYIALIPKLIKSMSFYDSAGKLLDIDKTVSHYCHYVKEDRAANLAPGWVVKAGLAL